MKKPDRPDGDKRKPFVKRDEDRKPADKQPYDRKGGGKPYGERSGKPNDRKPFGRKDVDRKRFEKRDSPAGDGERKPYPRRDSERKPYERKPYEGKEGNSKPYERKPYAKREGPPKDRDRKPFVRRDDDRKPPFKKDGARSRAPYEKRHAPSRSRNAKRLLDDVIKSDRPGRGERPRREDGPATERLHKYLARCGVASRRAAEIMITEGRVELNGELVTEMGVMVDPENDKVKVDGHSIRPEKPHYVLLNKPKGVITTLSDPRRRPTIAQYLPDLGVMLRPVGRLDMDSSGLLICTNDGNLADRLTHPSFGVEKEYDVIVRGEVNDRALKRLRNGVYILGKWTAEAYVEMVSYEKRSDTTKLRMIIHEGRNRQIRLMCDSVGHPVEALERVRIGPLKIRGLRSGEARIIGLQEVEELWGSSGIHGKKEWFENRVKSIREKRSPKPRPEEVPSDEAPSSPDSSSSSDQ